MTKKVIISIVTIIIIIILVLLGLGLAPLFNNIEINDDEGALPEDVVSVVSEQVIELVDTTIEEEIQPVETIVIGGSVEVEKTNNRDVDAGTFAAEASSTVASTGDPKATVSAKPAIIKNEVTPTFGHPASGTARVVTRSNGSKFIRFENFKTINGPNLHVYLAKDLDADDFIDLGSIRGTEGNINYDVPVGTDLDEYKYVLHWCVPFSVLFNYAELK